MKVSIVIPSYNESEGVAATAAQLRPVVAQMSQQYQVEVIFINDGSADNTSELLRAEFKDEPQYRVIDHPRNKGLGAALRTGFKVAKGDLIVTTDFDGTYRFETIPDIVQMSVDTDADVVTASPYHPKGRVMNVPRYRLTFSYGASTLYRLLISREIHTWTALFRVYRRHVVQKVNFQSNGFLSQTEILVKAFKRNYKVVEFPTVLHSRVFGQSSIKIIQVTRQHLDYQYNLLVKASKKSMSFPPQYQVPKKQSSFLKEK